MELNLCIRVENTRASDILDAVRAAEDVGFGGISFSDELMDLELGGGWSHDPWSLMSAAAAITERISIGSMVLNIANRDAGTTAVAAATLQDVSGGRVWLGLGAGTSNGEPFSRDQIAFGRTPPPPGERRAAARAYIAEMRRIWDTANFLRPEPSIPIFFGAFGPLAAKLAGAHADGIAAPIDGFGEHARSIENLVEVAREARAAASREGQLRIIAHTGPHDDWSDPVWAGGKKYDRLEQLGAERLVLFIDPDADLVRRASRALPMDA